VTISTKNEKFAAKEVHADGVPLKNFQPEAEKMVRKS
jgi:hypothetical protein